MSRPEDVEEWAWEKGEQFADMFSTELGDDSDNIWEIAKTHARALMAERERCAQVAEAYEPPSSSWAQVHGETAISYAAREIAAAIRKGESR